MGMSEQLAEIKQTQEQQQQVNISTNNKNIKIMRKFLMTLAAVLCCAMISTLFTACGSDEEKKTDDNTPVACGMSYMISIGRDLFDHANFTVEYYDANGKLQSEKMANELWEKEITTKLPGIVGVQVKMQMIQLQEGLGVVHLAQMEAAMV